ncbi:hypothetical protein HNP21_005816 [Bacillus aryabhattai]|uniref:Uncharacterized protein n=1 Tax=Priestia aryabhattai TaxID=412384 RepID=A0A7W3RHX4_PRIAR|nr:hypothetical protein [Priestia aryabhattai]MBA9042679.1 hypothetical protein [Priestia aryabhattai]
MEIGKADVNDLKEKEGEFNVYSIDVKNSGAKVYDARVEVYRDEPNSKTKYGLFIAKIPDTQNTFHYQNQPISVQSKTLEVVVTWKEESYRAMKDGEKYPARKFKQIFLFQ